MYYPLSIWLLSTFPTLTLISSNFFFIEHVCLSQNYSMLPKHASRLVKFTHGILLLQSFFPCIFNFGSLEQCYFVDFKLPERSIRIHLFSHVIVLIEKEAEMQA